MAPTEPADPGERKPRILLIDDEPSIVRMLRDYLSLLGYEVSPFTRSDEALEAFRDAANTFDLVLTDYYMPLLSGADIALHVNALRPELPILICAGDRFAAHRGLNLSNPKNIVAVMEKPVDLALLAETIKAALKS